MNHLYLLFLNFLSINIILLYSYKIIHQSSIDNFINIGNEIHQIKRYFNISQYHSSGLNESNYLIDFYKCFSLSAISRVNHCIDYTNVKYYYHNNRIWPTKSLPGNTINSLNFLDCSYNISIISIRNEITSQYSILHYNFLIIQTNCQSNWNILGGSTFDIYLYNNISLLNCKIKDNNNNKYYITCPLICNTYNCINEITLHSNIQSNIQSNIETNNNNLIDISCVNITVVLHYEHYDSYSGELPHLIKYLVRVKHATQAWPKYHNLLYLIADNQQFCHPIDTINHTHEKGKNHLLKSNIQFITGIWQQPDTQTDRQADIRIDKLSNPQTYKYNNNDTYNNNNYELYNYLTNNNNEHMSSYDYKVKMNTFSLEMSNGNNSMNINFPYLTRMKNSHKIRNNYQFKSILITNDNININNYTLNDIFQSQTFIQSNIKSQFNNELQTPEHTNIHTQTQLKLQQKMKDILLNPQLHYHFIGDSHQRYHFDIIIQYIYNNTIIKDLYRHHKNHQINNINIETDEFGSCYADDQSDLLLKYCTNFNNENINLQKNYNKNENLNNNLNDNSMNKHIIIFNTGIWDLSVSSIRRLFHANETGKKLLASIISILTGNVPCAGLIHFIWLLAPPHPLCFHNKNENNDDNECQASLAYRNNPAINALNEYYLNQLLNITLNSQIKLSIIDSYNIIKPRLIFSDDYETACNDHYLCRVGLGPPNDTTITIHTPGGDAVVEAILLAILHANVTST